MRAPKQRVRESSTQNYRRSKLSAQSISSKFAPGERQRPTRRELSIEDSNKFYSSMMRPQISSYSLNAGLSSNSWCLFDHKTQEIIGFRETQQREVASLTKIMTTILSLNLIQRYSLDKGTASLTPDIAVRISRSAAILTGTTAQLKHGKWVRLEDLLYGTMLPSGNDAAYLLA